MPAVGAQVAEEGLQQHRAAAPGEPRDPDDLARVDAEREVSQLALDAEAADVEHGRPLGRRRGEVSLAPLHGGELGAHDRPHDLTERRVRGTRGEDDLASTQDGHLVADVEDLAQVMGDEDDADAELGRPPDELEQPLDLAEGERRGRLVEDEQPSRQAQGLRDLDHLLLGDAEVGDDLARADRREAELGEEVSCGAPLAVRADRAEEPGALVVEEDVVRDAQRRDEAQLLEHHPDAGIPRLGGPRERQRLPPDGDAARRRRARRRGRSS